MEKVSKYVSYFEVTHSNQAKALKIGNIPNAEQLGNLKLVCTNIYDKVREHFRKPIGISSAYRSYELNQRIGGSKSSQHMEGKAIDVDGDIHGGISNKDIFDYIKKNCTFDQLIWEFGSENAPSWVHVSWNKNGNRGQVLRAVKNGGRTVYQPF
jgi:zinc D-Ala-D-Ala carboxypeptidase